MCKIFNSDGNDVDVGVKFLRAPPTDMEAVCLCPSVKVVVQCRKWEDDDGNPSLSIHLGHHHDQGCFSKCCTQNSENIVSASQRMFEENPLLWGGKLGFRVAQKFTEVLEA